MYPFAKTRQMYDKYLCILLYVNFTSKENNAKQILNSNTTHAAIPKGECADDAVTLKCMKENGGG